MSTRPFIPAPNTVSVEVFGSYRGAVIESVFHVLKGSPFTLSQVQGLRGVFVTWINTYWKLCFVSAFLITRVRIKALDSDSAPMEDYPISPVVAGTMGCGGQYLPGSACLAFKLATGLSGRSYRGRVYVPVTCTDLTPSPGNNDVSTTWSNSVIANISNLLTVIPAWDASAHLAIASFRHANAWRTTAVVTPVISVVIVDSHLDSQRRRLSGRGI